MAYNRGTRVSLLDSFPNNSPRFTCLRELDGFLEDFNEDLSDLVVIIDCSLAKREVGKATLQALMIEYPEVKFLFDDDPKWVIFNKSDISGVLTSQPDSVCLKCLEEINQSTDKGKATQDFKDMLQVLTPDDSWALLRSLIPPGTMDIEEAIRRTRQQLIRWLAIKSVQFDFLTLPDKNLYFVLNLVHTRDNLFDASNIRYAIKQWKYAGLDVHSRNFSLIQESRRDHLAVSVEEEERQNCINCYSLFANGFRVWPVTTANELSLVNKEAETFNPSIIVRDYDLQFYDSFALPGTNSQTEINDIRGFSYSLTGKWSTHVFSSHYWSSFYNCFHEGEKVWNVFTHLPKGSQVTISRRTAINSPIYYVSKGTWNVKVQPAGDFISTIKENGKRQVLQSSHCFTCNNGDELYLPGLNKPISGVYTPFFSIPETRERITSIKPPENAYLDTSREGHSHGAPLDIYSLVESMIRRAERLYQKEEYILSAILATESIEYLNGFHEALLLKAYQILAISENAIAMNTVGGDEESLKTDAIFRISKIEYELDWLLRRIPKEKRLLRRYDERREFKYSLLNQIFSECRRFCKEKEHFSSEDAFISAMAHVNEGFTPCDILHECTRLKQLVSNSWKAYKATSIIDYHE